MIADIRAKISSGAFEFSKHAVNQTVVRQITVSEIREALRQVRLLKAIRMTNTVQVAWFGHTSAGRPIHVQCSHPSRELIKIITVYEPDSSLWINFKRRR